MLSRELLSSAVFVLGVFIAACAGIGGGGLNVPFFIILFGFMIKEATPLSHAAVARTLTQFPHPLLDFRYPNRILILPYSNPAGALARSLMDDAGDG